jgi:hypothetical protein
MQDIAVYRIEEDRFELAIVYNEGYALVARNGNHKKEIARFYSKAAAMLFDESLKFILNKLKISIEESERKT